ncbi:MAG: hypothetical protein ABI999_15125 [Acidobacteriota bacterium]
MYRRPKFLEVLLRVREEMARDADYDADRFAEMVRSGVRNKGATAYSLIDEPEENVRRPRTDKPRS